MSFLINITSYISSLSKNVFNTKLINQSEIANIICLNLSYLFLAVSYTHLTLPTILRV